MLPLSSPDHLRGHFGPSLSGSLLASDLKRESIRKPTQIFRVIEKKVHVLLYLARAFVMIFRLLVSWSLLVLSS